VIDVTWSSRFRLYHRLAASYRIDRLILMGDAAHVHSPAGGEGMNTGVVDAIVLGELLADVVGGQRAEERSISTRACAARLQRKCWSWRGA